MKVRSLLRKLFSSNPGGCSQCINGNCYSAPCNLECRIVGDGCETIVMGGSAKAYKQNRKVLEDNYDYAQFFMQRVERCNLAMTAAGISIGDTIERVNGVYAGSDEAFAKLVLRLPYGTLLTVLRASDNTKVVYQL